MNKLVKKVIPLGLILSMGILAGCGSNAENAAQTTNTTKTTTKAQETKTSSETEKTVVKIGYLPLTHALPIFEEKELLDASAESNIEVELVKFGSWPELLDALNSERIDGASVLVELAIKSIDEGNKLKLAALGHRDGNVVIVANDINSAADLKGKNFAIPHRMSSHNILLNELLEKNGLNIADVNVVELAPAEMPAALASGQISGYCVAEPFGAKAVTLKAGKVLYQSNELWEDSFCCGLVLTDKFISDNGDFAKEYVEKYLEAGNKLTQDEELRIGTEYLGQEEEVLKLSLEWISYQDLTISEEGYNDLIAKMKQYNILDTNLKYEDVIYK